MESMRGKRAAGRGTLSRQRASRQELNGYIFCFPLVALLVLMVLYPLCYGIYISFFKTNLVAKWDYVGLKYYISAFTSPDFQEQLLVTLKFTLGVVAGHFVIGMLLAVLLNRNFKGRIAFRIILLLPWLFPDSVIALLFKWIFNPVYGVFNQIMMQLGVIDQEISWLGTSDYALACVIWVCIWKGFPMIMMMILAGLQSISTDVVEAARIDGASGLKVFRYVTLPFLRPVLMVTLVLDTIWWFKHYTLVWVLTGGGPGNDTALVSIGIYKLAFDQFNFGKAAAFSVIIFLICLVIGLIYRRLLDRE